jgi:decaprenylphospho-beta-D-erythro-pentofuranosid-2-ulose 2-reductase
MSALERGNGSGITLILGATSSIGKALARRLAAEGRGLIVAGRDEPELRAIADDLKIRYQVPIRVLRYDATDFDSHPALFATCAACEDGPLTGVVFCQGAMFDQAEAERDFALSRQMIDVNYTSAVSLLSLAAAHLARRGTGYLCALSSVAGDRGRQSNFLYGATKSALTTYLQGLRNRLARQGVAVITVKPGLVDTAMTWGLLKPGSPLVASPDQVARAIEAAIRQQKDHVYTPWFWRWIMAIIKSIPEPIFKRMRL